MPYPNWHAARMMQPERFDRFRNKAVGQGIEIIMGRMRGTDRWVAQAYRFAAATFTADQAREWMAQHNLRAIDFEPATAARTQAFVRVVTRGMQALYGVDPLSLLPAEVLAGIRAKDPHPFLQAYSICHEGLSTGTRVVGEGVKSVIRWPRAAVQSLRNAVVKGVKFFLGHNEDSSTQGRPSLGEVVWNGEREIDGTLHHVVVGHFPDRAAAQDMDICSQEGTWTFLEQAGAWVADRVHELTGIALARSDSDAPSFPGARRLGMVQALERDEESEYVDDPERVDEIAARQRRERKVDLSTVSFQDLAQEMRSRKVFPHQLFTLEDIQKDGEFAPAFAETAREKKRADDLDAEVKKMKGESEAKDKALLATTARARFEKLVEGKTLTPKQKQFVKESFPANLADASDMALEALVAAKLEDFKVAAKTFDIKEELPPQPVVPAQAAADKTDQTKAANNPLLEEDMVP